MRLVAHFTIPGKPVPKGRPRTVIVATAEGVRRHTYTPKRTRDAELLIRQYAQLELRDWQATGPLEIHCVFYFPRGKTGLTKTIPGGHIDLDNLLKLSGGDALKPWLDDYLIIRLTGSKEFGKARTEIGIWEVL
ncbi:RusA family crossover junction endodeoxyribonuclease [Patescibacteria group bacterium]|uniref:Putative endodeoxyribonuclease n=1 Tax=viral metagenome TaxID=1070528 RepID=A0A6M3M853_9ZZZZ|nr:RusA family crossover junction endodeoxyribonuclease [Patescibacteria group bacterium]